MVFPIIEPINPSCAETGKKTLWTRPVPIKATDVMAPSFFQVHSGETDEANAVGFIRYGRRRSDQIRAARFMR